MRRNLLLSGALLFGACNLPPKDPFAAAESALRRNDLLEALQAYDAVPVKHERYPDARAAAGDVEQRMRNCHELILEALMLRSQWRDAEALETLQRAAEHWPGQPSLHLWIAATEQRLRLFGDREGVAATTMEAMPAAPMVEIAGRSSARSGAAEVVLESPARTRRDPVEVPSRGPLPMVPMQGSSDAGPTPQEAARPAAGSASLPNSNRPNSNRPTSNRMNRAQAGNVQEVGQASVPPSAVLPSTARGGSDMSGAGGDPAQPSGVARISTGNAVPIVRVGAPTASELATEPSNKPTRDPHGPLAPDRPAARPRRAPAANDPVALGLVSVAASLDRGDLAIAVRDLMELARRFPGDARVNRRLGRLLHQRALMHYGAGAVAAAVADWRRVLELDPKNDEVRRLMNRAIDESQPKSKRSK